MTRKIFLASLLVMLAVGERVVWDLGPNWELVTMAVIISAAYWGKKWGAAVGLAILLISDLILGNSSIFLFTWSGFLIEAVAAGKILAKRRNIAWVTGAGVGGSLWFYLWTNLGVWLLDSWGMYSNDLSGLAQSYINGLPFLRNNLLSSIILVPVGWLLMEIGLMLGKKILEKNKLRGVGMAAVEG